MPTCQSVGCIPIHATAQTAEVTVATPVPGGGTSAPRAFFVTETAVAVTSSSTATADPASGPATAATSGTTATAAGTGTLTLAQYGGNPLLTAPPQATNVYFDLFVASGSSFGTVTVEDCNLGGGDTVYWYDAARAAWTPVSNQTYDATRQCVTFTLDGASSPSVMQLTRTEFAVVRRGVFLAPLKAGTANNFKAGSTIPVKLTLADGADKVVMLQVLAGDQTGVAESGTTSVASTNQFRYDGGCGCYIYNLGTKSGFTVGSSYTLVASVDGQRVATILITATK